MKKARFAENQIVAFLKEAESGINIGELCRNHGVAKSTFTLGAINLVA